LNQSYVSGYGTYPMQHPHHRFWGNDLDNGYPPPPPGVIAGGPNATANDPPSDRANLTALAPSRRYVDDIGSYSTNEVTINWNAPLAWVVTYLEETSDIGGAESDQPSASDTDESQVSGIPLWILLIVAAIIIVAVIVWVVRFRGKKE
jgi:endoglucanase